MGILKDLFLTKRKQPIKRFVATARGHAPWGLGVTEYFYNMYQYEDGSREYEELQGGQYHEIPDHVDYSTKAQVRAWLYGGEPPYSILSYKPLIDGVNKKIKKRTKQDQLICEITNESERSYSQAYDIDQELEKALNIQLGNFQNEKK
ncbi:hypothetical protein ME1_00787 [Bartonella vinsonii subsp. arupensis OK-94-513]|uniref:Uncharacterized protein n=1 Tax=Bartonella vinsonii subsp. arupensis OK-94-513 TaxID=1094562 RepID=J0QQR4_BARVI|nr:hypothetical protein [Bartonella vinsonii]EJF88121.1 hypothetical protein ME1_00787 [Bartonella vinsonii subsp. arupensis OK-94-513]